MNHGRPLPSEPQAREGPAVLKASPRRPASVSVYSPSACRASSLHLWTCRKTHQEQPPSSMKPSLTAPVPSLLSEDLWLLRPSRSPAFLPCSLWIVAVRVCRENVPGLYVPVGACHPESLWRALPPCRWY